MTTKPKPFCGKCGAPRIDGADKFCPDCGAAYPLIVPTIAPEEWLSTASDVDGIDGNKPHPHAGTHPPAHDKEGDETDAGPDISQYEFDIEEMPSRYPEAIKEAWRQVLVFALENEEYVALRNNAEFPGIERFMDLALLKDLCAAYDAGASLVKLEEYEPAQRIAMVIRETRASLASKGLLF